MSYRGALIGCGFFAQNHIQAWRDVAGADVVAVCDTDPAKAARFAEAYGATAFTDAQAMLAEVKPDFTDIVTTVDSHRPLVELAALHSKAVICQKPFAETLEDGQAMVDACQHAGVPLLIHENFRWQLPFRALKDKLESGVIGTPSFLRLSFRHGFDVYANQPYLREVQDLALTDVGLHLFDVVRFLLGDVSRVFCLAQHLNPAVKGEDTFIALLQHQNGAAASVDCSFYSHMSPDPFPESTVWLEGSKGTLELTTGYMLRVHADGGVTESSVEPAIPSWGDVPWHVVQDSVIAVGSHVVDILDGKCEPQPSGAHNLQTLALTLAAIESSRTGQAVSLTA
jgi:predicted dehydrogenase